MSRACPGQSRTELAPSCLLPDDRDRSGERRSKVSASNSSYLGSGQSGARGHLVKDWPGVREKFRPTLVYMWSDWAVTIR